MRSRQWLGVLILLAGCLTDFAFASPASAAPRGRRPTQSARRHGSTEEAPCRGKELQLGRLRVSQRWNARKQKCIVMVSADERSGKARSYLFNSEGMLMTFSVLGKGPVSQATGARTHLLLPSVQPLRVEKRGSRVLVHTTSGHVVTFDGASGAPQGISGGEFRVEPTPSAERGGGVELRTDSGIVVDFGFMRGGSPHEDPSGTATVSDGRGHECRVKNSDLMSYTGKEPKLVVASRAQWSAFFAGAQGKRCEALASAAR